MVCVGLRNGTAIPISAVNCEVGDRKDEAYLTISSLATLSYCDCAEN